MDALLIEPDGTKNNIVSIAYAIQYCKEHPGWTWEHVTTGPPDAGDGPWWLP